MPGLLIGARAEPETSDLRIVRNLLLVLLAVLLLPYLLTPLYRAGHPVSTLMVWRWLTGAPVSRQWVDFGAISPCAAALGGRLRGRQILQPSRHRLGRAARGDRRCRGRRGGPRRLDHHPAGGEKPVPVAWPQRGPQGAGVPAGAVDRLVLPKQRILEIYLNIAELGPVGTVRRRGRARPMPSAARPRACRRARRRCWRRSCPIRSGAAPAIPAPGCAAWPGPIWPGHRPGPAALLERKSRILSRFWPYLSHGPSFAPVHPL